MKKMKGYIEKLKIVKENQDGFSLLELVVAVGILAILSVVGLVAYSKITENARQAAVEAAAAEVYKGAFAYDANGDANAAQKAIDEWMDSSKKGDSNSIVVENVGSDGNICITASMGEPYNITASKGAGCDGVPAGDGDNNDTAADCFYFNDGTIIGYKPSDECGSDVVIPETIDNQAVVGIGNYAFASNQITSVDFGNSVKTIGNMAFEGNQLTSLVIPNSVETIGEQAFYNNNLTSVDFGSGVKTIGDEAFSDNQLTSVFIPDSVEIIGSFAFSENQLTSVSVPQSIIIESYAFGSFTPTIR